MFSEITATILDGVQTYRSLGVFLGGFVEAIIVPIPSPLITMSAGFLLVTEQTFSQAILPLLTKIALPYALGATLGNIAVYWPTYWAGKFFVDKFAKLLDASWEDVQLVKAKFDEGTWDEKMIVLFRAIPLLPVSLITIVGGAIRFEWKKFFLLSFIGLVPRGLLLAILGWWAKDTYLGLASGLDRIETIISVVILGLVFLGMLILYRKRDKWLRS